MPRLVRLSGSPRADLHAAVLLVVLTAPAQELPPDLLPAPLVALAAIALAAAAGVGPAPVACCAVVLMVADVAAPFPSVTTWMGLVRPKFLQPRLSKDWSSRLARKVNRLLPTSGTGDGPPANTA